MASRTRFPADSHIERHFTSGEMVRDLVIGMSDGLTVPFALAAGVWAAQVLNDLRDGSLNLFDISVPEDRLLALHLHADLAPDIEESRVIARLQAVCHSLK